MDLSYTFAGGLGDYILTLLGQPGNRLHYIRSIPDVNLYIRVSHNFTAIDLFKNNPIFSDIDYFEEIPYHTNRMENDINNIVNIKDYPKIMQTLWLSEEEEEILRNIKKPYAVMHPYASIYLRSLWSCFDIYLMAQTIAEVAGMPVVVLGQENFEYQSEEVRQIKCSPRLAVRIVENASFFVGTHSSMQCAAWVYNIPSFCIGPENLLLHNLYSPYSFKKFLKPLFDNNNVFMFYQQGSLFPNFFDYFLKKATSIKPLLLPEEYPLGISHLDTVSGNYCTLDMNHTENKVRIPNPHYLDVSAPIQNHNISRKLFHL